MEVEPQQVVGVAVDMNAFEMHTIVSAARIDPALKQSLESMADPIDLGGLFGYALKLRAAKALTNRISI